MQQEENVASEQWKIKELQSCTESCLSNPVLHLAILLPGGLHYRLGILHGWQREVAHDIKQCDVIAENNQQGIATTNNIYRWRRYKKILFDCIVSHYQPPLILSPPIDRRPKKLENMTHVLADRILRDFRILRVQQEENVASKKWKIIPPPNTQGGCAMHFVVKYVSVPWMLIL